MLFGNDVKDNNEFFLENKNVINMMLTRLDKHGLFLSKYFRKKFDKVQRDKFGRSYSDSDRDEENISETEKFKMSLATPSEELDKLLYEFAYGLSSNRYSNKASTYLERYPRAYQFKDIEIFGDISRHGSSWREKLKDELEARYYLNDIIKRNVFDIDQMVYVSYAFNDIDHESQANSIQTPLSFNEDGGYLVEFDALLIRYANTLNEEELDKLMDSICILVTDKVCRLMLEEKSYIKFIKTYVKVLNGSSKYEYADCGRHDATVNPKAIYMAVLISKVICDSVNNVRSSNDAKTMDSILNLADISIRNSGSVYGLGRASATIFSYLNRSKVRGRYLERYMDLIVETIEQHKGDMVSSLNRSGKFTFNINPRNMMRSVSSNRYCGLECDMIGLEYVYQYSDMIFRLESEEPSKFSIIGLESDNNRLESYKKKSRSELLKNLSDKERVTYNKFESEITRYRSDAINAKDNTRKNALFIRSRGLGKVIALELTKSKNEVYTELLVALDEARYQIDTELSNRDFNRERNTRLYGQIIPSSDWDY
ncbi:MAG: hypothetical protein ACRCX8_12800 [Sarcina sp.]